MRRSPPGTMRARTARSTACATARWPTSRCGWTAAACPRPSSPRRCGLHTSGAAVDGPPDRPPVALDDRSVRESAAQLVHQVPEVAVVEVVQDRPPGSLRDLAQVVLA